MQTALRELGELILYRQVFGPFFAGVSGALTGESFATGFASFKAAGGPVTSGRGYIVGETGPEFFLPSGSGTIVPNNQLGGNTVSVVTNVYMGSGQTTTQTQGAANQTSRELSRAVKAAVLDVMQNEKRQGGMLA